MQDLQALALPGWYFMAGRQYFAKPKSNDPNRLAWLAFVVQDAWHGGWVASVESPDTQVKPWRRNRKPYLFEGMRFDSPTAAMAAVEVELSNQ